MSEQPGCIFCHIAGGKVPARIVWQSDKAVAFADINPVAPVHIVVIPRQHLSSLAEADSQQTALLGELLAAARQIAAEQGLAKGYRVVINCGEQAGQTVPHLHLHVLGGRAMGWPPG